MTITDTSIDAPVETAILEVVTRLSGPRLGLVRWTTLRSRVPGTFWEQTEALCRLAESHRLHHVKIGGTPYVWPADDLDALVAAADCARRAHSAPYPPSPADRRRTGARPSPTAELIREKPKSP
jgi:hypothetical protein